MHLTAYLYKFNQRWIATQIASGPRILRDRKDHQLSKSFSVNIILPSMILPAPLSVSWFGLFFNNLREVFGCVPVCFIEVLLEVM